MTLRSRGLARCGSRYHYHMPYWARARQGSAPLPMAAAARRWRLHAFDLMLIQQRSHMHQFPSSTLVHERNPSGACCAFARDAFSCQNCSAGPHSSCRRKRSGAAPPPPLPCSATLNTHALQLCPAQVRNGRPQLHLPPRTEGALGPRPRYRRHALGALCTRCKQQCARATPPHVSQARRRCQ